MYTHIQVLIHEVATIFSVYIRFIVHILLCSAGIVAWCYRWCAGAIFYVAVLHAVRQQMSKMLRWNKNNLPLSIDFNSLKYHVWNPNWFNGWFDAQLCEFLNRKRNQASRMVLHKVRQLTSKPSKAPIIDSSLFPFCHFSPTKIHFFGVEVFRHGCHIIFQFGSFILTITILYT